LQLGENALAQRPAVLVRSLPSLGCAGRYSDAFVAPDPEPLPGGRPAPWIDTLDIAIPTEVPTGESQAFGVSPSGAIDVGNSTGNTETGEYPSTMTVWSHTYVFGTTGETVALNVPRTGQCTSTSCHVPVYMKPKSCDVDACTPAEKAQWCAGARATVAAGHKMTGGSGTGPVATGFLGLATRFFETLDAAIGGPLVVVGMAQGEAAYTANYVDSVCSAD
jgi:hypothetical protein